MRCFCCVSEAWSAARVALSVLSEASRLARVFWLAASSERSWVSAAGDAVS